MRFIGFVMFLAAGVTAVAQASGPSDALQAAASSGILSDAALAALSAQDSTSNAQSPAPIPGKAPGFTYVPYTTARKFKTATKNSFGPLAYVGSAMGAGLNQWTNTPWEWGQGAAGYADRFASVFGTNLAQQYFAFALDTAFHQDPRYFLATDRSTGGRLKSVIKQLFVAKQDSGGEAFAVGQWGSALGAGFLANAWSPHSNASTGAALRRSSYILATDVGLDLGKEFIPLFRRLNP